MQKIMDKENRARVLLFDTPSELLDVNHKHQKAGANGHKYLNRTSFAGRRIWSWEEMDQMYHTPWPEGRKSIEAMLEKIASMDLPEPKDVRRRQRWDDDHGEINVDRYLAGDEMFFRRAKRKTSHGPKVVSIIVPIGANCNSSAQQIFWRSAAIIAAVEKLEEFGYSCEVTGFWHSAGCYTGGRRDDWMGGDAAFVSFRVKEAGEDLNLDTVTNSLSTWFFRTAIFGVVSVAGQVHGHLGQTRNQLRGFEKYLGNQSEALTLEMPYVLGEKESLEAVQELINKVSEESDNVA